MKHRLFLCLSVVAVSLFASNPQAFGENDGQQQLISQQFLLNRNNQHEVGRDHFDRGANLGRDLKRSAPAIRGGRAGVVAAVFAACAVGGAYIYALSASTAGACVATVAVVLFCLGIFHGYCSEGADETATYEPLDDPPYSEPTTYPTIDEPMEPSFSEALNVRLDFD